MGIMTTTATLDGVTLSLIRGALLSAAGELGSLIERTSMSPMINEKHDYLVGFANPDGRFVALSRASVMAGTNLVGPIARVYPVEQMRPGDLYWYNDPYLSEGALSHSPDLAFVAPAFADGELIGFCAAFGHCWDIGGARAGSLSPEATEIFQEGVLVPPVRIVHEGRWNDEVLRMFVRNSRYPEMLRGDIRALTAAARLGESRLTEMAGRFGVDTLAEGFEALLQHTRKTLRRRLHEIVPQGTVRFADAIDNDGLGDEPQWVRLKLTREGEHIRLDCSESADQVRGPFNYAMDDSIPMMYLAQDLAGDDPSIILNGAVRQLVDELIVRDGSILRPRFPAPLGSRSLTSRVLGTAIHGLVARATDGQTAGAPAAYGVYVLRSLEESSGSWTLCTDGLGVGRGAHTTADGPDAIYATAQKNFPCEYMERTFPIRMERFAIHRDSGGPGRYRGGCGVVREFTFLGDTGVLSPRIGTTTFPAWGVAGGLGARPGSVVINPGGPDERVLKAVSDGNRIVRGDLIRISTSGGGGWGHPFDREAELVRRDVVEGFVSPQSAFEDYGVVLDEQSLHVDRDATAKRRESHRPSHRLFHRDGYLDEIW